MLETAQRLAAIGETAPPYDLLLMDLNYARDTTSGDEGLELVTRVKALDPHLPVVVMTAWSTVSLAVAAKNYVEVTSAALPSLRQTLERVETLDPAAQDARRLMSIHLPGLIERYERVPPALRPR